ncbi:MAG: autotransporter-associated beta strand repeat-containing protein [Kiritimatiellae bacterium]|nr:autotransporter-associated beta strand repeat-containing protein [Kiritimatiellia bacterium]
MTECNVAGSATLTINGGVFNGATLSGGAASGTRTLAFTTDIDVSTCTIERFDTISIPKGVSITISANQADTFTSYGYAVSEEGGVYKAKFVESFYWTPGSENTNWSNPDNWRVGTSLATTDVAPTAEDPAVISSAAEIVIDTDSCVAGLLTINAAVTFTGNPLTVAGIAGTGAITLGDGAGFTAATSSITLDNTITVTASSNSPAVLSAPAGAGFVLAGTLTDATGYLKFAGGNAKHRITGTNNFKGTIEVAEGWSAASFLSSYAQASANVKWIVNYEGSTSSTSGTANFVNQGSTVSEVAAEFGTLTGTLKDANASSHGCVIFTVGALCDADDTMALTYVGTSNTGRDSVFKMVGAGTFAIDAKNVRRYECNAGTIQLQTAASLPRDEGSIVFSGGTLKTAYDPSAYIVDSTSAIVFDDGGTSYTWATALASSNTAGFTKKGSGTLTLSAAPEYTGATTVEAGALILPTGSSYTLGTGTVVDSSYTGEGIKLVPATSMMAMVGGVGYAKLSDAITAATSGSTVTLLDNMWNTTPASDSNPLTETIVIEKDLTIDLGCHTLEANNVRAFWIKTGDVTITNGIVRLDKDYATSLSTASSVIRLGDNTATGEAKLTIAADCDIITDYCYGVTVFGNTTTETLIVNGTIEAKGINSAISGNGSTGYGGTTITINNGAAVLTTQTVAIYHPQTGTLNVYGTVTGGIEAKAGTVNVYETAEISALTGVTPGETKTNHNDGPSTIGYALAVADNANYAGGATLNVTGGLIGGGLVKVVDSTPQAECDIEVIGGSFTEEVPAQFCAAGYVPSAIDTTTQLYTVDEGLMITEGSLLGKKLTIDATSLAAMGATTAEQSVYLNTVQANGYYGWQNYVMNADGTTVLKPTYTASGTILTLAPSFGTARTGAGVGVAYKVQKKVGEDWTDLSGNTYDTADMDAGTEQLFRIKAAFSAE